ncbi:C-factor-like [Clupea harengus]|uniref:C-factor-like n=1 Tax=Clupea harengus TaxID=7950 RepID=A0A6P3WCK7_CLUHA|nr:C-factor-like [Clupea harengus]
MAGKACNVLITGANRGLGLEMVKQLAETSCPGRRIFAGCRDPSAPKSQSLQELAKQHPGVIHVIRLDVADLSSIKESAKQVGLFLGKDGLNLLVNNAGMATHEDMKTAGPKEMQDTFNTNIMGPMLVTKEFLPYLREAAKSSGEPGMSCSKAAVINISTILASIAKVPETVAFFPVFALPYRISKAGLNMLTVCNAVEFKDDGILFALLHPGWVQTDMGGAGGAIDAQESVSGMLRVMSDLTEKQSGAFLDYNGQSLPW